MQLQEQGREQHEEEQQQQESGRREEEGGEERRKLIRGSLLVAFRGGLWGGQHWSILVASWEPLEVLQAPPGGLSGDSWEPRGASAGRMRMRSEEEELGEVRMRGEVE